MRATSQMRSMRNVEMCGLFNNRKAAFWLVALAFAAVAVFESKPVQAAIGSGGRLVLSEHKQSRAAFTRLFPRRTMGNVDRATDASGGAKQTAADQTQAGSAARLRDPFKAPEPPPSASPNGKGKRSHLPAVLPPGVRGLLIDQLILEGVVDKKPDNAMIAVVTNKTNRAYFLRINENVFDGTVTMITPAAIYFRQRYYTEDDKAEWRTVEKQLSPGPGGKK